MMRLLVKAQGQMGYRPHGMTIHEWDISGSCISPRTREMIARPDRIARSVAMGRGGGIAYSLILHTRCRKCTSCRKLTALRWMQRATSEMRDSARTWFGTMTLAPESVVLLRSRARFRLATGGTDMDGLSISEQFEELGIELGKELTLYLKRVRAQSGAPLRFIAVAEAHKSGVPHLHILVHEADIEKPVRKALLDRQWTLGFTQFRLVPDARAAAYICKYLHKSPLARVRASVRYGKQNDDLPVVVTGVQGNVEKKAPKKEVNELSSERPEVLFGLTYRCKGSGEYGWHIPQQYPKSGQQRTFKQLGEVPIAEHSVSTVFPLGRAGDRECFEATLQETASEEWCSYSTPEEHKSRPEAPF